jgi:biotin transport system substrate-specific component
MFREGTRVMLKFSATARRPLLARHLSNASWMTKGIAILIGSLILALSAQIAVPMYPVPMSMQTYAVLIVAALGGWTVGFGAIVAYLLEGAIGLPVFANGGAGLAYMAGPTGGFLIGFAVSGAIVAFAAERGLLRTWGGAIALLTVAHLAVFLPGVAWLAGFLSMVKGMSLTTALTTAFFSGFVPFVAGTVLKTGLAVLTVRAADRS